VSYYPQNIYQHKVEGILMMPKSPHPKG